jgi:N-acetylmuramoyl-L-alanine amidase
MGISQILRESKNFDARKNTNGPVNINMLVLHYTGMVSGKAALEKLCSRESKVSAHLLIDEIGKIYRLVDDEYRAWHAGLSYWQTVRDINSCSIGIELVNPGHEIGYRSFPSEQINSLISITNSLQDKYQIPPQNILGHSDIAPSRKMDPGELFPWKELSKFGLGVWPHSVEVKNQPDDIFCALSKIGYASPTDPILGADILNPETAESDIIMAFQRHYLPANMSGIADQTTKNTVANILGLFLAQN